MNIKKLLLFVVGWFVSFLALLVLISAMTKTATPGELLALLTRSREAEAADLAASAQQSGTSSSDTSNIAASPADSAHTADQPNMQGSGKKPELSSVGKKSLQQPEKEREERLSNLVSLYNSMDARKAASIMDSLSDGMAAEILSRMRSRQAAKVLAAIPSGRAARITCLMSQSKRQ